MTEKSYGGNNGVREHAGGKLAKSKSNLDVKKMEKKSKEMKKEIVEDEEFDDDTLTIVPNTVPSREGDVLTRHLAMLRSFASCAFITLHEDDRHRGGYLYTADKHIHAPWSSALRKVMVRRCGLVPDGTQTSEKSRTIDGTILSEVDSSFENLLERLGHVNIATTETPRLLPLQLRARTNADLITTTLNYVSAT